MSQEYSAVVVTLLASLLPRLGLHIGSDALTTTASVLLTLAGGLWALYRRHQRGDITPLGVRK